LIKNFWNGVINSLLNHGLNDQHDGEADKQSKRIILLELGKGVLFQSFEAMKKAGQMARDISMNHKNTS